MSKENATTKEAPQPGVKPVQDVLDQLEDLKTAIQMYEADFSDFEKLFITDHLARAAKFGLTTKFSVKQENLVQKIHDKIPA